MSEYRPFRGRGRGRGGFQHGNNFRASMPNNFNDMRMPNPNYGAGSHFRNDNKSPRWQRSPHASLSWRPARFKASFSHNRPSHITPFTVVKNSPLNIKQQCIPLPGSEEARQKNIAEASARIKEQLELAESNGGSEVPLKAVADDNLEDIGDCIIISSSPIDDGSPRSKTPDKKKRTKKPHPLHISLNPSQSSHPSQPSCSSVEELNKKILTQFTFMSKGKIQNLVNNPGSTKYDVALQHLIRDMKLNLSCELRTMYNNRESEHSNNENTMIDHFNSLVPDLGVELVSLPDTMVAELSKMLQLDENNELEAVAVDPVENILVEPEDMFKQAQELLTNSEFLDDALEKSPPEDSRPQAIDDPFDRRSPIFNCPPPIFNLPILPPPSLSLSLNNISNLGPFSPGIPSPTESQTLSSATPRLETMSQQIEQIEKDLDIPVPDSANEITDTLKANLPNLFCQQSPLFRAADPSPFSKKLLEEFEEIAIRPVSSEPFTHLLNPILPSPPKTLDEANLTIDIRPSGVAPEVKKPNNGAKLFDFDSVWITKQPAVSSNNKQPTFTSESAPVTKIDTNTTQLNVTSFLQDVTTNEMLSFDDCTTSSGKMDCRQRSTSRTSSHSPYYDSSRNSNSSFPEEATSPAKRIPLDERIKQMMKMQDKGDRKGQECNETIKKQFNVKLKKKIKLKKQKKDLPIREPPPEESKRRVLLTEKPLNILKCKISPEPVKGPLVFKKYGEQNSVKQDFITKKTVIPPVVIKTEVITLDDESSNEKSTVSQIPICPLKEAPKNQVIIAEKEKQAKPREKSIPNKVILCRPPLENSVNTVQKIIPPLVIEKEVQIETTLPKNNDPCISQGKEEERSNWSDDNLYNLIPFSVPIDEADFCPKTNLVPSEPQEEGIEINTKDENEKEKACIENIEQLRDVAEDNVENENIESAQEVFPELDVRQAELETCNAIAKKVHDEIAKNIADIFDEKPDEIIDSKMEENKVDETLKNIPLQKEDSNEKETILECPKSGLLDNSEENTVNMNKIEEKSLEKVHEPPEIDKSSDIQEMMKLNESEDKPEEKMQKCEESKRKTEGKIEKPVESQEKKIEKPEKSRGKSQESAKTHEHKRSVSREKKHPDKCDSKEHKKAQEPKETSQEKNKSHHESRGHLNDNKKDKPSGHKKTDHSKSRSSTQRKHHSSSSKSTSQSGKSNSHSIRDSWTSKPNQEILSRLFDLDMQINKLMQEKWNLYQVLNTNKINNFTTTSPESFTKETSVRPVSVPPSESSVTSEISGPHKPATMSKSDASTNTIAKLSTTTDCAVNTDQPPPAVSTKRKAIQTQTDFVVEPIPKKRKLEIKHKEEIVKPLMVDKETNTNINLPVHERLKNSEIKSVQYTSESEVDIGKFANKSRNTSSKKSTSLKKSPKTKKINKVQYSSDSEEDEPVQLLIRRRRVTRKIAQQIFSSHSDSESAQNRVQNKPLLSSDSEMNTPPVIKAQEKELKHAVIETEKIKKIKKIAQKELKSNNKSIEETIDRVIENAETVLEDKQNTEKKKYHNQSIEDANNSLALMDEELREVAQKQITLPKKAVLETIEGQNKELSEIDDNSDTEYYLRGFESQSGTPAKEEITAAQAPTIITHPIPLEEVKRPNKKLKKKAKKSKKKSQRKLKKNEAVSSKHAADDGLENHPKEIRLENAEAAEEELVEKKIRRTRNVSKLDSESEITISRLRKRISDQKGVENQIVKKALPKNSLIILGNINNTVDTVENRPDDDIQVENNENINQIAVNVEKTSNVQDLRILNVFTLAQNENSESDFESAINAKNKIAHNEMEQHNSVEQSTEEEKEIEQPEDLETGVANNELIKNPTEEVPAIINAQESAEPESIVEEATEVVKENDVAKETQQEENVIEEPQSQKLEYEIANDTKIIKQRVTKAEVKQTPINILEEHVKPQEPIETNSNQTIKKIITKAEVKQIPINEPEEKNLELQDDIENNFEISKNIRKIPTKGEVKKIPVNEVQEEYLETKESLESIARTKRKRHTKAETKEIPIEKEIDQEEIKNRKSRKRFNKGETVEPQERDNENKMESRESSVEANSSKNNRKRAGKNELLRISPRENQEESESSKNMRKRLGKGEVKKTREDEIVNKIDERELEIESTNKNIRRKSNKSEARKTKDEEKDVIESDLESSKRTRRAKSETRKIVKEMPQQENVAKHHHEQIESDLELNTRKRKRVTKSESRKIIFEEENESESDDSNVKHLRRRIAKSETRKLENTDHESTFKNYSHVSKIDESDNDSNDVKSISIRMKKRDDSDRETVSRHSRKRGIKKERRKSVTRDMSEEKDTKARDKMESESESTPKLTRKRLKKDTNKPTKNNTLETKEIEFPKSVNNKMRNTVSVRNRALRSSISSLGSNESINISSEKQPEVSKSQIEHEIQQDSHIGLDDYCSDSSSKSKQIRANKKVTTAEKIKNNMSPCFVRLRRITPERLSSFHSVSLIKQLEDDKTKSLIVKDTETTNTATHNKVEKNCDSELPIEKEKQEETTTVIELDKKITSTIENVDPPVQKEIHADVEKHVDPEEAKPMEDVIERNEKEVANIGETTKETEYTNLIAEKEKEDVVPFEPGKNFDHNVSEEIVTHQTSLQKNEESIKEKETDKESVVHKEFEDQVDDILTDYVDQDSIYCKGHMKSILDIKIIGDEFLAASEDGTIYKYCCQTGALQDAYTGHKRAVTCLFVTKGNIINVDSNVMYTGSLDCSLKCYNIDTAEILHNVTVSQAIQCLDSCWGYIFLGTYEGLLFIYNIKKKYLNPQSLTIASSTVLMIKATQEGSRHILIVASRKREIMVRDAFTGLLLRTMCSEQSPTIYSLYLDRGSVYCGTSDKGIIIVEFNTGAQTGVYNSGKGVVCMVKYKQLLFAGCYDGFIYIYNTKMQKHVATIAGPGEGMVLSLVVHNGMIIAGNKKDHLLKIWKIPPSLLAEEKV